jgi:hypothetical protein
VCMLATVSLRDKPMLGLWSGGMYSVARHD